MRIFPEIKKYISRPTPEGWESDRIFTSRLEPSFRINDQSGVLYKWVSSFFVFESNTRYRPILILGGKNDLRRRNAAIRAGRYYELLQSWKHQVPTERILSVIAEDIGPDICPAIISNDRDELDALGLSDKCYFQKSPLYQWRAFMIMRDLYLLPSSQGGSFYRLLLSRLGINSKNIPLPLIIDDSRGVNGLQKQFRKEWNDILPILEQHSIQLEL